jgi:ABC-type molybdate transport system substrate-binding protein
MGVSFQEAYGALGDQSRAMDGGQPADYVAFSLETDMTRLMKSGKVAASWNANQYHGFVTDSIVVLVVRKGNPKNIKTWDDLTKPGVDVITPNPFSSGSARWNIMAACGAQMKQGKTLAEAQQYLADPLENVLVQNSSGRAALGTFTGGKGDVLRSQENEAIFAQRNGEDIDSVVPDQTILIQNPVAIRPTAPTRDRPKSSSTMWRSPKRRSSSPTTAIDGSPRGSLPTIGSPPRRARSPSPISVDRATWRPSSSTPGPASLPPSNRPMGLRCQQVARSGRSRRRTPPLQRLRRARRAAVGVRAPVSSWVSPRST